MNPDQQIQKFFDTELYDGLIIQYGESRFEEIYKKFTNQMRTVKQIYLTEFELTVEMTKDEV